MKNLDIIKQLQKNLPYYTDLFSNRVPVVGVGVSGVTTTLNLDPAQTISASLKTGDKVFVQGVRLKNPITAVSTTFFEDGTAQVTITTDNDHDLTASNATQQGNDRYFVEVVGLEPAVYNGTFPLETLITPANTSSVPDRYTFIYTIKTTLPCTSFASGFEILPAQTENFFTGYQVVSTNAGHTLVYDLLIRVETAPSYIPFVDANTYILFSIRISGSASFDLFDTWYSKQPPNNFYMCVVVGDTIASKDFRIESDANKTVGAGVAPRQRLITQFTLYVYAPFPQDTSNRSVSGRALFDTMQDLFVLILKSVNNIVLPSPFTEIPWAAVNVINHGFYGYNESVYIYQYTFESCVDIIWDDMFDTSYPTRAFRDLYARYLSQVPHDDAILASFGLDLDEDAT